MREQEDNPLQEGVVKTFVSTPFWVGRGGVLYKLNQFFLKQLQYTLNDIADIICPLREDGELKKSPEKNHHGNLSSSWKKNFLLVFCD